MITVICVEGNVHSPTLLPPPQFLIQLVSKIIKNCIK